MTAGKISRVLFCILFSCAACLGCFCSDARAGHQGEPEKNVPMRVQETEENAAGQMEVFLYFVHPDKQHLTARPRYFVADSDEYALGQKILTGLLEGPRQRNLTSAWPRGTSLRAFFLDQEGQAWVDLNMEEDAKGLGAFAGTDTFEEILAVYSVVHSLCLNLHQVTSVKILVNGSDRQSLGGHLCLDDFYTPDMALVK